MSETILQKNTLNTKEIQRYTPLKRKLISIMKEIRQKQPMYSSGLLDSYSFMVNPHPRSVYRLLYIVLISTGCEWMRLGGGCTMCGFCQLKKQTIKAGEVYRQFQKELNKYKKAKNLIWLLIYVNGSFLNIREVPIADRNQILQAIARDERIIQVDLESLPEFITERALKDIRYALGDKKVGIAIGLESANEFIRNFLINKKFYTNRYLEIKTELIRKYADLKISLVLKPPLLTEFEAIDDTIKSFIYCQNKLKANLVYIAGCNVHFGTLTYYLWKNKLYNTPMLKSIVQVANKIHPQKTSVVFGGFDDYPQPEVLPIYCKKCSKNIKDLTYYTGNSIPNIKCSCQELWDTKMSEDETIPIQHRLRNLLNTVQSNLNLWLTK